MLERFRRGVGRLVRGGVPVDPMPPVLLADHEEIRDISRQLTRTRVDMERTVMALRSWARDASRRVDEVGAPIPPIADVRAVYETVGGLAHNFNNSLAAIIGYTELLLREVEGEASVRRLRVIRDVALETSVTVRRLQEFVSRQPQLSLGPVPLPGVVAEAVDMTAPRWRDEAQRRGVLITLTQDLGTVPPVESNARELRDALVHLVLNAVAAMPEGGLLAIRAAVEESGWVVLEVRDTGVGMPEEVRRRITEGALRGSQGGLAEVADIVERHGGSLSVAAAPPRGTVLRLRFQASRFQISPPGEGQSAPLPTEQVARVLLVDDDPRVLVMLSDMLRSGGHVVTTAGRGEDAVALFDPRAHDVVITDLGMPNITGWEVAERVKARSAETPVFILTGWGEGVMAHEGSRFVDRVIAKPISAEVLLGQLRGLRRARAGSA
ncbi:MAG: response regulator [Candidatus Rokubacteria bacterium]|nr:response regulator [Candidatus Rokubacteria bacterium]